MTRDRSRTERNSRGMSAEMSYWQATVFTAKEVGAALVVYPNDSITITSHHTVSV